MKIEDIDYEWLLGEIMKDNTIAYHDSNDVYLKILEIYNLDYCYWETHQQIIKLIEVLYELSPQIKKSWYPLGRIRAKP